MRAHKLHLCKVENNAADNEEDSVGPRGVRALPLDAGINKGGHYFKYLFLVRACCVATILGILVRACCVRQRSN